MKIVVFKITGGPHGLLMNNPDSMGVALVNGPRVQAKPLSGQEEADSKVYKDEKGILRFPAMAFRSSSIRGATGRKIGKNSAAMIVKGAVFPVEQWVQILDAKSGKPKKDYEVFTTTVINPTTKGRHPRSRPLVKNWMCKLPLELDETIDEQTVVDVLNQCGRTVGVGDFRPFCPNGVGGPYGRFSAELA